MFIIIKRDIPSSINEPIVCNFVKAGQLLTKPCDIPFIFQGFFNDDETEITKDHPRYSYFEEMLERSKIDAMYERKRKLDRLMEYQNVPI